MNEDVEGEGEGEGEVIDLDSRRAPSPHPQHHRDPRDVIYEKVMERLGPPQEPKPHPFTGKTPTERAIPTGGYRSKRQADLARKQAKQDAERLAFYDAAYESTLDAALCDYYRKMAAEERVQEHLQTPEDTLHVLSCLRYRWIARQIQLPCYDLRSDLWHDGSIPEMDALRIIGMLGGIGLWVPKKAMPLIHKSEAFPRLTPDLLRLLAPYCSWIRDYLERLEVEVAAHKEAARV